MKNYWTIRKKEKHTIFHYMDETEGREEALCSIKSTRRRGTDTE